MYVSLIVGTSTSELIVACRAPAPLDPLDAFTEKCVRRVSSEHATEDVGRKLGQGAPDGPETKLAEPESACHSVTAPAAPTLSKCPCAEMDPLPIGPVTDMGAAPLA